jgi:hypothetical protein
MSEPVGSEIAAALVAFQAECNDVAATSTATVPTKGGGQYSYKYADLSTVLAELRPKLERHGLAILQSPTSAGADVGVRTLIVHKSGEFIDAGTVLLPMTQQTPQGAGACITYARRYALGALAGIATDHDDDAASQQPKRDRQASSGSPQDSSTRSEGSGDKVFDQDIDFGKFKGKYTWRQMTEGSIKGERHSYLEYMEGDLQQKLAEELDSKFKAWRQDKLAKVRICLKMISDRADRESASTDESQPEVGDAGAF